MAACSSKSVDFQINLLIPVRRRVLAPKALILDSIRKKINGFGSGGSRELRSPLSLITRMLIIVTTKDNNDKTTYNGTSNNDKDDNNKLVDQGIADDIIANAVSIQNGTARNFGRNNHIFVHIITAKTYVSDIGKKI